MKSPFQHSTSPGLQESTWDTKIRRMTQVQISITEKHGQLGSTSFKQTEKESLRNPYELQHACWHLWWCLGEGSFRYFGCHLSIASTPLRTTTEGGSFNRKLPVGLLVLFCKTSRETGAWGCSQRCFSRAHKHPGSLFHPVAFPSVSWFIARAQDSISLLSLWQNEVLSDWLAVLVLQFHTTLQSGSNTGKSCLQPFCLHVCEMFGTITKSTNNWQTRGPGNRI